MREKDSESEKNVSERKNKMRIKNMRNNTEEEKVRLKRWKEENWIKNEEEKSEDKNMRGRKQ